MGGENGSIGKPKDMSSAVDFQTFNLDGQVHDLMWCGNNDEVVLMHTSDGTVYRSRDRGLNWKSLTKVITKAAYSVKDEDQEVSFLTSKVTKTNNS